MVVDEDTGTLLGEVTGINGAHGTAIATGTGHGFATSGNDQSVVMFDLKTFKALGRIPAAEDADAIIYDAPSNRVFTFNGDAHSSTVIDPQAGTLITNIPLGGKPEYGASAGDGKVYANLTDTSEVVEIDAKTATVTRRWSTAPCKQPGRHGDRHRAPSPIQRMPQRRNGGLRLSGRQGGGDGADRHGRGWRRLRPGRGRCVRLERRRHATVIHQDIAGSIPRRRKRADAARLAQYGRRPDKSSHLRRVDEVRGGARIIRDGGNRTRSAGALTALERIDQDHSATCVGPRAGAITVAEFA